MLILALVSTAWSMYVPIEGVMEVEQTVLMSDGQVVKKALGYKWLVECDGEACGIKFVPPLVVTPCRDYRMYVTAVRSHTIEMRYGALDVTHLFKRMYIDTCALYKGLSRNGLDLSELGLSSVVRITPTDGVRKRDDWRVEIYANGRLLASWLGAGEVLLWRTDVFNINYTARVAALTLPNAPEREVPLTVDAPVREVKIEIETANVTVVVQDSAGRVRTDWRVEIAGIASGNGMTRATLVKGGRYTAVVHGLIFPYVAEFVADRALNYIDVPTAVLNITVLNSFGKRLDVLLTINGTSVTPGVYEIAAGRYVVSLIYNGWQHRETVELAPRERRDLTIVVPTGVLNVEVYDRHGNRVYPELAVTGAGWSMNASYAVSPIELVAGEYVILVGAETSTVTVEPGEVKTVKLVLPDASRGATSATYEIPIEPVVLALIVAILLLTLRRR